MDFGAKVISRAARAVLRSCYIFLYSIIKELRITFLSKVFFFLSLFVFSVFSNSQEYISDSAKHVMPDVIECSLISVDMRSAQAVAQCPQRNFLLAIGDSLNQGKVQELNEAFIMMIQPEGGLLAWYLADDAGRSRIEKFDPVGSLVPEAQALRVQD